MVLAVEKPTQDVIAGGIVHLTMALRPFISPGKLERQSLTIVINGVQVFKENIDADRVVNASLSAAQFFINETIEIIFYHPDAARPCDLIPSSKDKKYLSFAVYELCLTMVQQSSP